MSNTDEFYNTVDDEIEKRLFEQFKLLSDINLKNNSPITVKNVQENIKLMIHISSLFGAFGVPQKEGCEKNAE